jgi:arsenate reductase (thioredoxin)
MNLKLFRAIIMKFFEKSKTDKKSNKNAKTVLFVCVENAGRSQMAEGFFKKYAPKGFKVQNAGTKPVSQINSIAVQAMKEVKIDISKQKSKELTDEMIRESNNVVVNMGCMDKSFYPTIFLPKVIEWNLKDPKGKSIEDVRKIRDEIEKRVKELVAEITTTTK